MPKFIVTGDVLHAFQHEIEAENAEEAREIVERMSHRELDNVERGSHATGIEIETVEEVEDA